MVCFKLSPPWVHGPSPGVEVIGIFLGMLYGWLIANDSFWPAFFGLLFLGLTATPPCPPS